MGFGFDRIEFAAKVCLFLAFAVIPRATLQGHMQNIEADEMGSGACAQHARIGLIRAKHAQFFCGMNTRLGHFSRECGTDIADRRDRLGVRVHDENLAPLTGLVYQMLAQSEKRTGTGRSFWGSGSLLGCGVGAGIGPLLIC